MPIKQVVSPHGNAKIIINLLLQWDIVIYLTNVYTNVIPL